MAFWHTVKAGGITSCPLVLQWWDIPFGNFSLATIGHFSFNQLLAGWKIRSLA
jgi:hypothetical protein